MRKPVNQPITNNPANAEKPKTGRASNEYKEDFGRHLRGKKPLHNVLSESVDADGGYLVPEEFEKQPDKILGFDVYTTPFAPAIAGGALPIAFGDFQNYWIGDRGGKTVQRLNELYATNGQVGYVATERVDGKVILPEAIKLLKMKS